MKPTLRQIYNDLIAEYNINTSGEIVTAFCDKGTVHSYIEYYDKEFAAQRDCAQILEIGLMTGASLLLWSRYFDEYQLTGIDLRSGWNQPCAWHSTIESDSDIELHFGIDSTVEPPVLNAPFDIILDDGAHDWASQYATFLNYWPLLRTGGSYYIEDIENDLSMAELKYNISQYCKTNIHFDVHRGILNGRADDQILRIRKLG